MTAMGSMGCDGVVSHTPQRKCLTLYSCIIRTPFYISAAENTPSHPIHPIAPHSPERTNPLKNLDTPSDGPATRPAADERAMTDPELLDLLAAHFAVIEGLPGMGDWQPGPVGMTVRVGRAYLSEAYPALHTVAPHPDGGGWRALAVVKQEMPDGSNYYSLWRRKARTRSERCFAKKTAAQDACFISLGFSRSWVDVCDTLKGMTMKSF
jgi:hypothetical protein